MTRPTHCPKCGHDLAEPLAPRDLFSAPVRVDPLVPAGAVGVLNATHNVYVGLDEFTAPDSFERFWKEYPRRVGKKAAEKAFAKLRLTRTEFNALLAALAVQKASDQWNRQGVQYVPHPATWLHQRRWEDDPAAYGRTGTPGQPGRVGLAPGQKLSTDDSHLTE